MLQIWRILSRRLWIVVTITATSALLWLPLTARGDSSYTATIRVLATLPSEQSADSFFRFDKYYAWSSSEFLADDLAEVLKSQTFRNDVAGELEGGSLDGVSIQSVPRSDRSARVVTLLVTSGDLNRTKTVSEAAAKVIEKKGSGYFSQLHPNQNALRIIDPPSISEPSTSSRSLLNLGIRIILAIVAGMALVFFLHYIDNTFYDAAEVEDALGLPVVGEIPVEKRG
ncbi:MAG: hypothetical protein EXR50_05620 [Dehalococcoidia bacterium]|nr:hypothetical protein [Dehalococcoidia bacterium]